MISCYHPGYAFFLRFKHHNKYLAASRLNFSKTLGSNGCTNGAHASKVLIQVSSRLRTRRIPEENKLRS